MFCAALVAYAILYLLPLPAQGRKPRARHKKSAPIVQITLKLRGMTCGACVANVTRTLNKVKGVTSAKVSLSPQRAVVRYNPRLTSAKALIAAIKKIGFGAALPPPARRKPPARR